MVRIQKAVHLRAHLIYYSILYSCSEEYVFPIRVFSYSKSNPTLKKQTVSLVTNIPVLLAVEDSPKNPYSHV